MGCNSSSVVPLGESDIVDGAGIKVRINPSTPETVKLSPPDSGVKGKSQNKSNSPPLESSEPPVEILTKDFNVTQAMDNERGIPPPPPMAFEVPVNEESLIKKHPPKRFRRLEELQQSESTKPLTHEVIDNKQQEAEMRRKEILIQRIQSAQQKNIANRKLVHSDAVSEKSDNSDWEKDM